MERRDLETVARMFLAVFRRKRDMPCHELTAYLEELCFGSPVFSPDMGSLVYEARNGTVLAALIGLPLGFREGERSFRARLLCSFMAEGRAGVHAAAALNRHFASQTHDLVFSDTAESHSVGHWQVNGGEVLPVESLEWRRVFRPARVIASRIGRPGVPLARRIAGLGLTPLAIVADLVLRRLCPRVPADASAGFDLRDVDAAGFVGAATPFLARFDVRPDWEAADFGWLCGMASRNAALGPLRFSLVETDAGETIAACAWCAATGGPATVLNLLCAEGREREALAALLGHLDRAGHTLARGMAHPFLFVALQHQPRMIFRHRGFFCYLTRNEVVREAIAKDRFYAGGLSSESWSRLLTDF